jgi:quercetin dioxygenase-like cupin family protein
MSRPTVIGPGGGELVGDAPDRRVEILSDHDALHATWSRFGPGRDGADLHIHRRHTDLFYVLAGELTVMLGPEAREVPLPAGTLVRVPPLVVHGFRNAGAAELRYVNLHAPGVGFADYMRALRDGRTLAYDQEPPPGDGGRPATEAVIGGDGVRVDRPELHATLLADVEAVAVAEAWSDPGDPSPPHVHRRHAEFLYVLDGELSLLAGDRKLRGRAGTWVQVPAGVPHACSAAGGQRVRFLALHAPSCGFGTFVRDGGVAGAGFDQEPAP